MGKKRFIGMALVAVLLLVASVSDATIKNRGVHKKADIDLGKINIEDSPNEHRALADGYNRYLQLPKPTNAQQITPASGYNGAIYYDSSDDILYAVIGGSAVDLGAAASTETLDAAYTAGATILLDATGNLSITTNPDSNPAYLLLDTVTGSGAAAEMIKITTTSGTITDAIDLSDAGIVNAINIGANVILGGEATIDFTDFDVSADGLIIVANDADGVALTVSPSIATTTAIDVTDANITNSISVAANKILLTTGTIEGGAAVIDFTNFDVSGAGAIVGTSLDVGSGNITTTGNLDVGNVLESAIQPASGNLTIDGATGASTITIGNLSTAGITISDNVTFGVTSLFSGATGLGFRQASEVISSSIADQLDIDAVGEVEIATAILDVNVTDSSSIQVTGTSKNFDIATSDGDITLTAVGGTPGDIILNAGDDVTIDAVGLLELNSSAGVISIGNDAVTQNINLGTGAAARIVTLGEITTLTEVQIDGLLVDINAGSSGLTMDAGAASNLTTSAGDLTLESAAASVNINANETVADQIKLNAQGTVASTSAINITTTNGGIMIDANGATNGDITIDAANDIDMNAAYLGVITLDTADDATADATAIADITITAGAKGAGTGDGGDVILVAGDTTGGVQGYIKLQDDVLVQTTEKIYFQDTGTFINSPANGKIEIEADGAGNDDITLDGGVTIPTGHILTIADAGSITLNAEKVTAHKEVSVAVYATANTANSFGILPIIANSKITHISVGFVAIPASGGGTVLLEVYNRDGGAASDNLLNAATYDLEGMTDMVAADMTLTGTGGDLQPDDGDFVYVVITSNNGDMTGGTGGVINIKYTID
ncbi:hypothetical protein LCGC14_0399290 [marine sediment metagenome]|uniref:Uncharacterized protein n=1 Tax=marine sediment metagenome TaxID=412755 RepID=A0A0F9W6E1_9ZZZZ